MRTNYRGLVAVAVATLIVGLATPAHASEGDNDTGVLAALADIAPETLDAVADVSMHGRDDAAVEFDGAASDVVVPINASAGIVLGDGPSAFGIGLPNATDADPALPEGDGIVSYDNNDGSTTVPIVKEDGSVQIVVLIDDSSAPVEYQFPLDLPEGARATLDPATGAVAIVSAAGEWLGGVAPPWAKDANGAPVPTHYVLTGSSLVQVVEHAEGMAYPVVADPFAGQRLIERKWFTSTSKGWVFNVTPTWWGRFYSGTAHLSSHWAEAKEGMNSTQLAILSTSIREQFYCHVMGNLAEPNDYNMEAWRPYKAYNLQLNLWDRCNP